MHCTYRLSCERLTDDAPPARSPWHGPDASHYTGSIFFRPLMFRVPPSESAQRDEDDWVAVMPVPITERTPAAYSPRFVAALSACTGLLSDDIVLMLDSGITHFAKHRLFGSIVLRGPERRVQRGREAVIMLMDAEHHRSREPDSLLPAMERHMQAWCADQELQHSGHRPHAQHVHSTDAQQDARRLEAHAPRHPAAEHRSPQRAPPPQPPWAPVDPPLFDGAYPALFAQQLDTMPISFSRLQLPQLTGGQFSPRLCLAPPFSTSPLSYHMREPLFVVRFPFLLPHLRWLLGDRGEQRDSLAALAGIDRQNVADGPLQAAAKAEAEFWSALTAVGTALQLDVLMEAVFTTVERLQQRQATGSAGSAGSVSELAPFLHEWKERRRRELRPDEPFFALQSRGLRCPPLPAAVPPPLPPPELCRPCLASFDARGCPTEASSCPFSHGSFAQHFGLLASNLPVRPSDIPAVTEQFAPVLARLPPPSFSFPAAHSGFVLCVPLPRLAWVTGTLSTSPFLLSHFAVLREKPRLEREGEPAAGWLNLVAELPTLDAVDELLEAVLFFVEEAHLLQSWAERNPALEQRLQLFREHRRRWTGDRERQLLALEMRGVGLRCPPLPPPPPPAVPAHTPFIAVNGYAGSSSVLHPPPPPYPFSYSLPSPPAVQQAADSAQLHWFSLLSEMKQRGLSMSHLASDLLIPDFTASDAAFVCCRRDAVFACVPIPATAAMRDAFCHQPMAGLHDVAAVEKAFAVEVFVPRLLDDAWRPRNTQQLPWLSVCVKRTGQGLSADVLDSALQCLIARCRQAVHGQSPPAYEGK